MSNQSLRERIKAWYKALPEITLPNIDSEDGTFMEVNMVDLVALLTKEEARIRIDELERLNFQEASGYLSGGNHIVRQQVVTKRIKELQQEVDDDTK